MRHMSLSVASAERSSLELVQLYFTRLWAYRQRYRFSIFFNTF